LTKIKHREMELWVKTHSTYKVPIFNLDLGLGLLFHEGYLYQIEERGKTVGVFHYGYKRKPKGWNFYIIKLLDPQADFYGFKYMTHKGRRSRYLCHVKISETRIECEYYRLTKRSRMFWRAYDNLDEIFHTHELG